ncbi:MAG: citramalate synthase [Clostridia bacterium]|nr:citramalate synthase [Clostridia bacterium]
MKLEIYDTTLRDGMQGAGISFTDEEKFAVIDALDRLGICYIEAGYFAGSDADIAFFDRAAALPLKNASIVAFGSTRRANESAENCEWLRAVKRCRVEDVAIFGKASERQVELVLRTTPEKNLEMIADTVSFLKAAGKRVIFDAEHFFDGYSDNPFYAMRVIETAAMAGADRVVLCDTNGGMLPDIVGMTVEKMCRRFPDVKFGIHCHNDLGMAVACTLSGILGGAVHLQGTVSGIGERCGNANLCTLIPLLQLKLGYECIDASRIGSLTGIARQICELANFDFNEHEPFVGGYAFAHKAGTHIDAVRKSPGSFEHIDPSDVGNRRNMLISELSGRSALAEKMCSIMPGLTKNSPEVAAALAKIKQYEAKGYQYENAEASLMLLLCDALGRRREFFRIDKFQVVVGQPYRSRHTGLLGDGSKCTATIKVTVGDAQEITAAEGDGPVNALDLALRKALLGFYPVLDRVRLTDFKVRVSSVGGAATASAVRVFIESTDGESVWRTTGVSTDIIDASWQALLDSIEFRLMMEHQ